MAFPKIEGYVFTEKLGSGSYSTVYKAYTKVGARSIVAVKCVDKSRLKQSCSAIDNIITEIRLLKSLTHPHIVQMKEFTWDDRFDTCFNNGEGKHREETIMSENHKIRGHVIFAMPHWECVVDYGPYSLYYERKPESQQWEGVDVDRNIYIITEYCCGGDLSKYIHKYGRVPERQVLYFLQQLASALKFLREKGVVHMDLKPHNLLLHKGSDGKYILKVADFGFAQYMSDNEMRSIRGSPLYMAPEMIIGQYDARVDLWSVGVIMYECLFGRAPYSSTTFKELLVKIEKQAPIVIPSNSSISPGCRDLLIRLLQHDPNNRISYEDFFNHEYLDLYHMPSKENYDKAVALIKRAIELDSNGQLTDAFACYRDSLLYLVPLVQAERDDMRKAALTHKLNRYMERAEEIKEFLKYGNTDMPQYHATQSMPQRKRRVVCCGNVEQATSYDFTEKNPAQLNSCTCISKQSSSQSNGQDCSCNNTSNKSISNEVTASETPTSTETNAVNTRNQSKFTLRRLFQRQNIPQLDNDSSDVVPSTKDKQKTNETNNDMCKIT